MAVQPVTDDIFLSTIVESELPVLVDFWAPWCGPCRAISATVENIAERYGETLAVRKLDIDDNPRAAEQFNVLSIPTLILFRDGQEIKRIVGAVPEKHIVRQLFEVL